MADTRLYGAPPDALEIKLNYKMMQYNPETGDIEAYDHNLVKDDISNIYGGYLMPDDLGVVDMGSNNLEIKTPIFKIDGILSLDNNQIALSSQASIIKGTELTWAPDTAWTFDNDEGKIIVQGLSFSVDNNYNVTLSADDNPTETASNIRFNSPVFFDGSATLNGSITANSNINLNNNNLLNGGTLNGSLNASGNTDMSGYDIDDAGQITLNGTFATSTEIIPPIVRLNNGQKLGGEQKGSQIKFSLYEFDTERYGHYLTSTHSGSSILSNRIDLYLCDTTDQNSVDSGVNHSFTFGASINRSRQTLGMDGNTFNLEGGSFVFDTNNSITKIGNDWQFDSFGVDSGNFGFLTDVDLNSNNLMNVSSINGPGNGGFNITDISINNSDYTSIDTTGNNGRLALSNGGVPKWFLGQTGMIFNGNGKGGATQPDTYFYYHYDFDTPANEDPSIRIKQNDTLFNKPIDIYGKQVLPTDPARDPILRLQQGQGSGTDEWFSSAQLAFGFNGTNTFQHFVSSSHNSSNDNNNRIDFFTCNGTSGSTIRSNVNHVFTLASLSNTSRVPMNVPTPTSDDHATNKTYVDDNRVYFAACDGDGNNTNDNLPSGITYSVVYDSGFTYYTYTFSQNVGGEGSAVGASADNGGLRVEAAFPDADDVRVNPTGQSANNIFVMFN